MLFGLFRRRWFLATLIVISAVAVMVRLGIWQLERLETRRAFNARVLEQQSEPALSLDAKSIGSDLYSMEYRQVTVRGKYIPVEEIVLRNQAWQGNLGVYLFTPLLIEGTDQIILVHRGWIPSDQANPQGRARFAELNMVTLFGVLRRAETDFRVRLRPDPTLIASESRLDAWNNLDLDRLAAQMNFSLLPVYLQRIPDGQDDELPYAQELSLDLTEGPHLGYAGQWFLFALVLGLGYPVFVQKQEQGRMAPEK